MEHSPYHPLGEEREVFERHCRLALHSGTARIGSMMDSGHPFQQMFKQFELISGQRAPEASEIEFAGSFLLPASGNCLFFLHNQVGFRLNHVFGKRLTVVGEGPDGPFKLECPEFYVQASSAAEEHPAWAVASPTNCMVQVTYGNAARPPARVVVMINNFDFEYGNWPSGPENPGGEKSLRVQASGRNVDFEWRKDHQVLRHLLDIELVNTTALVVFSFDAWDGATDDELLTFAHDIASLCSVVARQHTGTPLIEFLDSNGRVVRRFLVNSIESPFRENYVLRFLHFDTGLPKLFQKCFGEHVQLQRSTLWRRLVWLCAGIEDSPYLEQKCATLMSALELLMRNCLIEKGHCTAEKASGLNLKNLIGAARKELGWKIPRHYTAKERYRLLRNAVSHGGDLPAEVEQIRHDFDKWWLFLLRRLLIRLGFDGDVASPDRNFASHSPVDDFSEEHNSFGNESGGP